MDSFPHVFWLRLVGRLNGGWGACSDCRSSVGFSCPSPTQAGAEGENLCFLGKDSRISCGSLVELWSENSGEKGSGAKLTFDFKVRQLLE